MTNARLAEFRRELNVNIASGAVELPVTAADGGHPVVVALEDEPLFTLIARLRAIGGFANLFVRGPGRVRQVSVLDDRSAVAEPEDRMTGDERPGATADVGMFLDYLERRPGAVVLSSVPSADRSRKAVARDTRMVEFTAVV